MQQAFSKPVSGAQHTGLWGASRQGKARKYYTASSFPPPSQLWVSRCLAHGSAQQAFELYHSIRIRTAERVGDHAVKGQAWLFLWGFQCVRLCSMVFSFAGVGYLKCLEGIDHCGALFRPLESESVRTISTAANHAVQR
ncbi:hypothetical protein MHYP_G00202970 [Metynnis hypsauchen]